MNRHGPCGPQDFKSCASTNFATPALFSGDLESFPADSRLVPPGYPNRGAAWHNIGVIWYEFGEKDARGIQGWDLRRRPDSNRCIKVLQTSPLPLGYVAVNEGNFGVTPPYKKSPATWWDWGRRGHSKEKRSVFTETFGAITDHPLPRRAERETGFEPATSTLARLRSTN